jgi:hypothetical protein
VVAWPVVLELVVLESVALASVMLVSVASSEACSGTELI